MAPNSHPEAYEKTDKIFALSVTEHLVSVVRGTWKRWQRRRADLRHYRQLDEMEEHILRDIGVTRADIAAAKARLS